jgi:hypothetical protein
MPALSASSARGVGHGSPIQPLTSMRRAEAASRGNERPRGVRASLQVITYIVEPSESVTSRNLLAKEYDGSNPFHESSDLWPKMPFVCCPLALAGRRERLARARGGPDWPVVGPSGEPESVGPDPDAGEEVALPVSAQVAGLNISY